MSYTLEYTLRGHLKAVLICREGENTLISDTEPLPWCFECSDKISVKGGTICHSSKIIIDGNEVVLEGMEVLGELKVVGFIAYVNDCKIDPEKILDKVTSYIVNVCTSQ